MKVLEAQVPGSKLVLNKKKDAGSGSRSGSWVSTIFVTGAVVAAAVAGALFVLKKMK
jgi:hypothetical protein